MTNKEYLDLLITCGKLKLSNELNIKDLDEIKESEVNVVEILKEQSKSFSGITKEHLELCLNITRYFNTSDKYSIKALRKIHELVKIYRNSMGFDDEIERIEDLIITIRNALINNISYKQFYRELGMFRLERWYSGLNIYIEDSEYTTCHTMLKGGRLCTIVTKNNRKYAEDIWLLAIENNELKLVPNKVDYLEKEAKKLGYDKITSEILIYTYLKCNKNTQILFIPNKIRLDENMVYYDVD